MPPMPGKSRSVLWSFNFAIAGVVYALRTQRNMRIHVAAAVLTLVGELVLQVSGFSLVAIVFAISLVFVTELVNTAIENMCDLFHPEVHSRIKVAKDCASAAVFVLNTAGLLIILLFLSNR